MSDFSDACKKIFNLNNLDEYAQEHHIQEFEILFEELIEKNKLFNLTAATDMYDVIALHFADSLLLQNLLNTMTASKNLPLSLIDIGSGAGFPALPLAIVNKNFSITSLDATEKKVNFIKATAAKLKLSNLTAISGRAEDLSKTALREKFSFATARAVAKLNILSELALPFVKTGGYFFAMKGPASNTELESAKKTISLLGGQLVKNYKQTLKTINSQQERHIIIIKKNIFNSGEIPPQLFSNIEVTTVNIILKYLLT